jgi:hypothetical protein
VHGSSRSRDGQEHAWIGLLAAVEQTGRLGRRFRATVCFECTAPGDRTVLPSVFAA